MQWLAEQATRYLARTPETDAIDRLVNRATADSLSCDAQWDLMLEIVDRINSCSTQPELLDTVALALRRQLLMKSHSTTMLALTLAEVLIKNCREPMHQRIGSTLFMATMKTVARRAASIGRDSIEEGNKALELIKDWGEAFLSLADKPHARVFVHTYRDLRQQGVRFSGAEHETEGKPPVLNVPASSSSSSSVPAAAAAAVPRTPQSAAPSSVLPACSDWAIPSPSRVPRVGSELAVIWNVICIAWEMLLHCESKVSTRVHTFFYVPLLISYISCESCSQFDSPPLICYLTRTRGAGSVPEQRLDSALCDGV